LGLVKINLYRLPVLMISNSKFGGAFKGSILRSYNMTSMPCDNVSIHFSISL
jgi:hypothetical protein